MTFLEAVHKERRLPLSHWRYRLLHWCFNEDATSPEESDLPLFLYRKYCPLFHLTNFIAIFSPIIFLFRVGLAVALGIWSLIVQPILNWFSKRAHLSTLKYINTQEEYRKSEEYLIKVYRDDLLSDKELKESDLEFYISRTTLPREKAVEIFYEILVAFEEACKRQKEIKQRRYEQMVFWSNVGRIFVGWMIYAFYIALAVLSVYLVTTLTVPFINLIKFIFSADYSWLIPVAFVIAKIVFFLVSGTFVIYTIMKAEVCHTVRKHLTVCLIPIELLCKVVMLPFRLVHKFFLALIDFISVFYEQNCPPITIISDDEAEIEESVCNI